MTTYVYDFTSGNKDMKDLLGGKGANLCEMTNLGLPVPPGFVISTKACRHFLSTGSEPAELDEQIDEHLRGIEERYGRRLGDPENPLLISVRSGGKFSMPGMMETILNIGLTDLTLAGLARFGSEDFAWDCYRRLIHMFGRTVCGITTFPPIDGDARAQVTVYRQIFAEQTGREFPQNPRTQLREAIQAVYGSWRSERATLYRRQERIPEDLGTAVNVQAMVFGNLGPDSGSGVAFTRDPATGAKGVYGDYLTDAQGEDVVAGIRNTVPLSQMPQHCFDELIGITSVLEARYQDLCDIEFTVEKDKLWMLQTRVGKRTAAAAFIIATQLVDEGVIDLDEALRRVSGDRLAQLMFPTFDLSSDPKPLARGVPASPGAAVGRVVFDSRRAASDSILVRRETNPDDLPGMLVAQGILTSRGGKTSHAAVVARGLGKTCVCGADDIDVDAQARQFTVGAVVVSEGDLISIDGTTGAIYLGEVEVRPSTLVQHFEGHSVASPLVEAVDRLLAHADRLRRLGVRANADTPSDAARARRFGAEGIGLCRTEHMFLGERRVLIERLILAETDRERQAVLDELLPLQRNDFVQILEAMDGLPVIVRLLDPPLHEFLPPLEALAGEPKLLAAAKRMHEQNPMLGLRGVRLGLIIPQLYAMQTRAVAEAARIRRRAGGDPRPEIMIPLVGSVQELREARRIVEAETSAPIGTMIEVPRAALTAAQIATAADFFSFGTNDLTQMTWGFSRDDVEGTFFPRYLQLGIFPVSPFESLDRDGVGRLITLAVLEARESRPRLSIGVCGEHGGDPESVHFFHQTGLDYVSCSAFRVPIARLEAGRAAVLERKTHEAVQS